MGRDDGVGTGFIGRAAEVGLLETALAASRLVTIVGPAGVGKTRLAKEVAQLLGPVHPDGVRSVELAPLSDPALVESAVRSAVFGSSGTGGASDRPDPAVLVVLDNCEHLLAAVTAVVDSVLASTERLRVVTTSRHPLGSPHETVLPLDPLGLADATQLFVDQAKRHDLRFEAAGEDFAAIERMCTKLDGLPLSVELAAAHVRALGLDELERRLDDQLLLLRHPAPGTAPRSTLEEALRWGYGLLPVEQQDLLRRLAVFAGSFSVAAAETVCSGPSLPKEGVYPLLVGLVDASFVATYDQGRHRRFRLLEPIRQFGLRLGVEGRRADEPREAILRRQGRFWLVGSPSDPKRIESTKGLVYLARLVSSPYEEVTALDLVGGGVASGDLGPMLDAQAATAYRRRLAELDDDREHARRRGDAAAEDRAEAEREAIVRELAAATGILGRPRRAASSEVERARMSATKAVRAAIARIAAEDSATGAHLERSVRTGVSCVYAPVEECSWHL